MRRKCQDQLDLSLAAGFTAVAFVPTFVFDSGLNNLEIPPRRVRAPNFTPSFDPTEVEECLQQAWSRGMGVIYQPHLEGVETISGDGEHEWRADFDFVPTPELTQILMNPFFNWVRRSAAEIRQAERQYLAVIPAAELETSTAAHPTAWLTALALIRQELARLSLRRTVPIGFNPNWFPRPYSGMNCSDYSRWVASVDFIAPSFYPSWQSQMTNSTGTFGTLISPAANINGVRRLLQTQQYCEVPAYARPMLNIGEFAIGPSLAFPSNDSELPDMVSPFYLARRELYRRMLAWAAEARLQHPLTLWTVGRFDVAGVGLDPSAVVDPQIVEELRAYTRTVCPQVTLPRLRIRSGATRLPSAEAQSSGGGCRQPPSVLTESVRQNLESLAAGVPQGVSLRSRR
jgi:hypothetical protein